MHVPLPCEKCPNDEQVRKALGCGFDGYAGEGTRRHPDTGEPMPTCAWYLAQQPAVVEVRKYLQDYKRGTLGEVWDLPNALYECLQIV